jgi:hypothetical protein
MMVTASFGGNLEIRDLSFEPEALNVARNLEDTT